MRNQEDLIDSITKHLDDLKGIVRWALLLSVLFWWAGYNDQDPIKALGMDIKKDYALFVAVAFYLVVNLSVWDRLYRIGDILESVNDKNFEKATSKLTLHNWIINPFSYFGNGFLSRINNAKGFGLLIIVWWVCNSSLYALSDNHMTIIGLLLQGTFLLTGLASMRSITRIENLLLERFEKMDTDTYKLLKSRRTERSVLTFIGIGIGGIIAFMTMMK